jgi:hypothetical protein
MTRRRQRDVTRPLWISVVLAALATGGCQRGYKTADDLEADDRGPRACWDSCKKLGLQMSAFVLVEHSASACVCAPPGQSARAQASGASAGAAHALLEQQRQQAAQRNPSTYAPPAR